MPRDCSASPARLWFTEAGLFLLPIPSGMWEGTANEVTGADCHLPTSRLPSTYSVSNLSVTEVQGGRQEIKVLPICLMSLCSAAVWKWD